MHGRQRLFSLIHMFNILQKYRMLIETNGRRLNDSIS